MFIQRYTKSQSITGRIAHICRFLTPETTALVLQALSLVRPIETIFAHLLHGATAAADTSQFLFARNGERMSSALICDVFERITDHYVRRL